jgi:hypothetical protein
MVKVERQGKLLADDQPTLSNSIKPCRAARQAHLAPAYLLLKDSRAFTHTFRAPFKGIHVCTSVSPR